MSKTAGPPVRSRVRVLVVASEERASEIGSELSRGVSETSLERVETDEELRAALDGPRLDAAICDDGLTTLEGPVALRRIKQAWPGVPVIVLSSSAAEGVAAAAMNAGADDVIGPGHLSRLPRVLARELHSAADRRAGEEARRFAEEIIAGAGEGVIVYGPDLRYLLWNPFMEELTGLSASDVFGRHPRELFPDIMIRQGMFALLERALAGEKVSSASLPFHIAQTGRSGWVSITYAPHRSHDGRIVGVIGIVQDITERRQLEEQFLQSQKMEAVGRLAGGVAHDFNNLLTAILGYTDLLLAQVAPGDAMRGDLEEIARAGERAASLTRQLLAFSRRQMLEPKPLDLNAVVTNVEKMLRRLIGEDVRLVARLDPRIPVVRADPGQLEQVLVNLAVNSRDAMPSGGTIIIETRPVEFGSASELGTVAIPPGRYARLDFADTGVGMESATLARIFEPFFTTKEKGKGTGLGLATAYGIVKQSGGYITCWSEPGRGTRFQIFLPESVAKRESDPEAVRAALSAPKGSETVLLVEDEEGVRRLSKKLLEAHGYEVLEASGGPEAIEIATRFPGVIHLLLTDIMMPGMDGPEVAERIRALRPEVHVLFMSGYTDALPQRLTVDSPLLHKPFTPQTLAKRVREALAG